MISPDRRKEIIPALIGRQVAGPVRMFICDSCARFQGYPSKRIPDSGNKSWLCQGCNHFNIGSYYQCVTGDWLKVWIVDDLLGNVA